MSVRVRPFGITADGRAVDCYRITNRQGAYVELLSYGAALRCICVPDRDGILTDVCLGYDTVEEYEQNDGYFGATVGRCANRIGGGTFVLNGKEYVLAKNDGDNHNHGGIRGFDRALFSGAVASDQVILSYVSPDGEEGYPGEFSLSVTYSFDENNALFITYDGISDQDTVVNLTNHGFFNLNGHNRGVATNLILQISAESVTEKDESGIPTGKLLPVAGTDLDFTEPKPVCGAFDQNFVLCGEGLRGAAVLFSNQTGIVMTTRTTQPGLQLYTANFVTPRKGKGGAEYDAHHGICLETQHFPDAVHHGNFPSTVLKAGEEYREITQYVFTTK